MPVIDNPQPLFRDLFSPEAVAARDGRPAAGMFLCNGDQNTAEICAGAGLDYLLIDAEHTALSLEDVVGQLRVIAGYRVPTMVRVPANDPVLIKQFLDLGAQTLLVPMVDDAEQAAAAVAAARYPGGRAAGAAAGQGASTSSGQRRAGVRGVGSALARSGRWNRTTGYLADADAHVSVIVQIESETAVGHARAIAETDGVDGVFIGPSDLSATMGLLGQQSHPEVVAAVKHVITEAQAAGTIVGVNAFARDQAQDYVEAGADYVNVGADVALLARATEALADTWCPASAAGAGDAGGETGRGRPGDAGGERASY